MAEEDTRSIQAGNVRFFISHRKTSDDHGVSIQVYGKTPELEVELLRFDCFENVPHYHYGPDGRNERIDFDRQAQEDLLQWSLGKLNTELSGMIVRAGYQEIASQVDPGEIGKAMPEVEAAAKALA